MKNIWIIGLIIIFLIAIAFFTRGFDLIASPATGAVIASNEVKNPSATDSADVKLPLSEISEKAKWYEFSSNGVTERFFAVKASDGSIKTAFDACDVCYKSRKGYRQEGNFIVCNNCGKKFLIDNLGTENKNPGGCWPGHLPNTVEGGNLVIKKSDLDNGRWRFA